MYMSMSVCVCVCVPVSGSSAVESAHLELETLRPRLLCFRPVTGERRIEGQRMGSRGSLRHED